jgi:hypothetical protein
MARKHQPLIRFERPVIFIVVAFEAVLPIDRLLRADEAELEVSERSAVVGMPTAQHRAADVARHAADRGSTPNPARRRIAHPRLAIAFVHIFNRNAADPVRQVVILRRRHRRRQPGDAEFFEPGEKPFLLLPAENAKHELGRVARAATAHDGEDQTRKIGVIEVGDAAPGLPFRRLLLVLVRSHRSSSAPSLPQ